MKKESTTELTLQQRGARMGGQNLLAQVKHKKNKDGKISHFVRLAKMRKHYRGGRPKSKKA